MLALCRAVAEPEAGASSAQAMAHQHKLLQQVAHFVHRRVSVNLQPASIGITLCRSQCLEALKLHMGCCEG